MAKIPMHGGFISGLPREPYRHGVGNPEGVVLHETGAWGGTAHSNWLYESRHWENAFVHYFVDWDGAVRVADTDYLCWGCGHTGNQRFVQIELVRTRDRQKFNQSYKHYVNLVANVLHEYNLKPRRLDTLWTHHDITRHLGGTTHTDPDAYLEYHGTTVRQLIHDIEVAYRGEQGKPKSKGAVQLLLNKGDSGRHVKELQKDLIKAGYGKYMEPYGADGQYGNATEKAVREFQKDHGLKVDGIAGPKTLGKLKSVLNDSAVFTLNGKTYEVKEVN